MSLTSFDLYWIVTHNDYGAKELVKTVDETCREAGNGMQIIIAETSGLPHYEPTRAFYENNNFLLKHCLRIFMPWAMIKYSLQKKYRGCIKR